MPRANASLWTREREELPAGEREVIAADVTAVACARRELARAVALAKVVLAFFADQRSSRFSRSSSFTRSASADVTPGRAPPSISAWRTHFLSVSFVIPSLPAIDVIAAHYDSYSRSNTIRTARSRTSAGYRSRLAIPTILSSRRASRSPGRFRQPALTHRGSPIASSPTSRLEVRSGMASSLQAAHPSKRPEMRERRMRRSAKQFLHLSRDRDAAPPPPAPPPRHDEAETVSEPPVARYDRLSAEAVLAHLDKLTAKDLARLGDHERSHRNRASVLAEIDARLGHEPWPGYDALDVDGVRFGLDGAHQDRFVMVLAYERAHRNRAGVVLAAQQRTA